MFDVSGKVVLVTGGTSGIGLMIARGFAAADCRVYVISRKADACEQTAAELNELGAAECFGFPADLGAGEASGVAKTIGEREGRLDVLVNNAGITWGAPLEEYPVEAFEKVLRLNVTAAFDLTRLLAAPLRAAATDRGPARVINVGSVEGLVVPDWENYAYPASKAALHMLTRQLARNLAPEVTVNAIAPGPFPSRMIAFAQSDEVLWESIRASVPLARVGEEDDAAGVAVFLASRAASYITGAILPVDGGLTGAGHLDPPEAEAPQA